MAPTAQPSMSREQQQALAKARARARVSAGGGMGPTNPMVAQGQAAQREYEAAGSPAVPKDNSIRPAPAPAKLRPNVDLRNVNRAPQTMGPGYAETPGSEIVGSDLQKGIRTIPQHVGNAAIGAVESAVNLPADLINSARQADAAFVPTTLDAARNANRMPQMAERVGKQPNALSSVPMVPTVQAPRIPIADEDQSVSGALLEGLVQYALVRKPLGMAAKGGGVGAQLGKDIATTGIAFGGNSGRVSDMIDPATIPEGPLRDYAAWLKTQPEDSPIMGRLKNMIEDATVSGPAALPFAVGRGAQAIGNALKPSPVSPVAAAASPSPTAAAPAPAATVAPAATPSAPVAQPAIPQAPPGAAQAGPTGAGQQPSPGPAVAPAGPAGGQGAGVLNATPTAVGQSPVALAKSDARIIGRLLKAGGVARNDVNNLLTGLVQAYQGSNSSRLPLAFFAEEYLPTVLPKQTADDVIQKLRGFGRERYSANGPKDSSRSTMRNTVDTLRSTQQDNLSGVMDANLYKGKLIGQEDKLNAQLEQNARTAYSTALENASNRLLNGKATQAERDALGEIQSLLHNEAFLKEVPAHLRVKALRDGIKLEDFVQQDPIAAAHWLQSELRQAVTAAEGVGGMATSESRLYGEMRTTLLEQLEKVVPGYRGARKAHGDIYGAKEAIDFGGNFFKSARSEVETARLARQFKAMSTRQKTAATMSIRDALKNEFRNKAEDTAAKVTRLQQAGVLDALETVLGADGKRVADAIRNTVKENERIRAVDMMSGSNTADNLAQMEAAQEAVRSPVNKAIGSLGDNRSWAATLTGDALLAVNGLPPVLTGGKIASSAVGKLGKPSARKLASATKTLYDLPTPGANALASPPRAPRASGPRSPKPTPEQAQATLDDLLRQYDALDHRANPDAGQKLLRQIDRLKKQLAATPNALATPPRPPVKAGFGGSKQPLPMDEAGGKNYIDQAVEHFGVTDDLREAGYLLPDGRMLDLSGRHDMLGGDYVRQDGRNVATGRDWQAGVRHTDHRELPFDVQEAKANEANFGNTSTAHMLGFQKETGAIRIMPGTGISVSVMPSDKQIKALVTRWRRTYGNDPMLIDVDDAVTGKNLTSIDVQRVTVEDVKNALRQAPSPPSQSGSSKLLAGMGAAPEGVGAAAGGIGGGIYGATAPLEDANKDGVIDASDRQAMIAQYGLGGVVSGGLAVKGARMGGGAFGNALKRSSAPPALETSGPPKIVRPELKLTERVDTPKRASAPATPGKTAVPLNRPITIISGKSDTGKGYTVTAEAYNDRGRMVLSPEWPTNAFDDLDAAKLKRAEELLYPQAPKPTLVDENYGKPPAPKPAWEVENPKASAEIDKKVADRFVGLMNADPSPAHVLALREGVGLQTIGDIIERGLPKGKQIWIAKDGGEIAVVDKAWHRQNPQEYPIELWNRMWPGSVTREGRRYGWKDGRPTIFAGDVAKPTQAGFLPSGSGKPGAKPPANALAGPPKPKPVEARREAPRGTKSFSDPRLSPGENKTAEMVLNGYTYDEIADEAMTSVDVIKRQAMLAQRKLGDDVKLPRPGMGKRPPGSTKRDAANSLFGEGLDNATIAQRTGLSIGNVRTYRSYWKEQSNAPVASVEGAAYNPPAVPARPFEADYPQKDWPDGPPVDAQGRLTRDMDRKPLDQSSVIIGRNKAPGYGAGSEADRSLRDRIAIIQTIKKAGSSLKRVPRSPDQTSGAWGPKFNDKDGYTGRGVVQITDDLDRPIAGLDDQEVITLSHELAHSIDFKAKPARDTNAFNERAWGIDHKNPDKMPPESVAKVQGQLERVYQDLNNPVDGEVKIRSPRDHGYEAIDADRELWAEAIRAYMWDPNYIKTVAPDVAFMIRHHVNRNSSLRKTIQFNAIPTIVGVGGLGLGAAALNGQPAEAKTRSSGMRANALAPAQNNRP